jgi:predicted ATPase
MQAIRQRVAALSEPARQALDAAAVVRRRVSLSVLSAVLAQPEEAVLAALEAACQARLLEEQGKVLSSLG